jgi:hypothetical protein
MAKVEHAEDVFAKVYEWRRHVLEDAGYDHAAANLLASQSDVDLHQAVELLEEGCGQELALEILL